MEAEKAPVEAKSVLIIKSQVLLLLVIRSGGKVQVHPPMPPTPALLPGASLSKPSP